MWSGDGFRKFKTDGPSAVWVMHWDQLQVLQIFSIATLDEKSEVGWWHTGGSLFALLVACGLSDLFWIKSEETRWYGTIFFTSALVANVVLTAMGWCGKCNHSHFGSGGFIIWDIWGWVKISKSQSFQAGKGAPDSYHGESVLFQCLEHQQSVQHCMLINSWWLTLLFRIAAGLKKTNNFMNFLPTVMLCAIGGDYLLGASSLSSPLRCKWFTSRFTLGK